jgi:hypothetical protein
MRCSTAMAVWPFFRPISLAAVVGSLTTVHGRVRPSGSSRTIFRIRRDFVKNPHYLFDTSRIVE